MGDWMLFENMGAYTVAAASTFNGFQRPTIYYVMSGPTWLVTRVSVHVCGSRKNRFLLGFLLALVWLSKKSFCLDLNTVFLKSLFSACIKNMCFPEFGKYKRKENPPDTDLYFLSDFCKGVTISKKSS